MLRITGPNWTSTRALREAAASIPCSPDRTLPYGASPCNKLEAFIRLREAGVLVPDFVTSCPVEQARRGEKWWRRLLIHRSGMDIATHGARWRTGDFWTRRIENITGEFRVHCFAGKAFRTGMKVQTGVAANTGRVSAIHSDRKGWSLCYSKERMEGEVPREQRKLIRRTCEAAAVALGLGDPVNARFSATDCLLTGSGEVYVLEVNTAPALGDNTLARYIQRLREWVGGATPPARLGSVEFDDEEEED